VKFLKEFIERFRHFNNSRQNDFINNLYEKDKMSITLYNGDLKFVGNKLLLGDKFLTLKDIFEDVDELEFPTLNFYCLELFQLSHHQISNLSKLVKNSDIVEYMKVAECLQVDKLYIYSLADELFNCDIDLKPLFDNEWIRNYFNYRENPGKDTLPAKFLIVVTKTYALESEELKPFIYHIPCKIVIQWCKENKYYDLQWYKPKYNPRDLNNYLSYLFTEKFLFSPELIKLIEESNRRVKHPKTIEEALSYYGGDFYRIVPRVDQRIIIISYAHDPYFLEEFLNNAGIYHCRGRIEAKTVDCNDGCDDPDHSSYHNNGSLCNDKTCTVKGHVANSHILISTTLYVTEEIINCVPSIGDVSIDNIPRITHNFKVSINPSELCDQEFIDFITEFNEPTHLEFKSFLSQYRGNTQSIYNCIRLVGDPYLYKVMSQISY
jgi:hypothetical protein